MNWFMNKYLAFKGTHPHSQMVFILGTGRSGTHWIGNILAAHEDIRVTFERPSIFRMVTAMALNPDLKPGRVSGVVRRYRVEHARVAPRHYVDKSHPNLWLATELAEAFPNALFVGIERNPYATVASMLRHSGVLRWCEIWEEFPIPNRFLGITESNRADYEQLSLAGRCALRWLSHADRMRELRSELGERLEVFGYEDLIENTRDQLHRLQAFLKLRTPIPQPSPKRESLDKWRTNLTSQQRADIERIVGFKAPDGACRQD